MSALPTYSFLPWLRQGMANTITSPYGDAGVKTRATVQVSLQLLSGFGIQAGLHRMHIEAM